MYWENCLNSKVWSFQLKYGSNTSKYILFKNLDENIEVASSINYSFHNNQELEQKADFEYNQ